MKSYEQGNLDYGWVDFPWPGTARSVGQRLTYWNFYLASLLSLINFDLLAYVSDNREKEKFLFRYINFDKMACFP